MNLKNVTTKKDFKSDIFLRKQYHLSNQYQTNNKPVNQREDKKEDKKKVMNQNLKTKIVKLGVLLVHILKTL